MMYTDKKKQRKTTKERVRRYRMAHKPKALPTNFGEPDCECKHCEINRNQGSKHILNHGPYKKAGELANNELNRVSLLGDLDYVGVGHS